MPPACTLLPNLSCLKDFSITKTFLWDVLYIIIYVPMMYDSHYDYEIRDLESWTLTVSTVNTTKCIGNRVVHINALLVLIQTL